MKNRRRPFVLLPMGMALLASAQVTIGPADMPAAGDTVRFRSTATLASMAETGPGHTWDFSALVPGAEGADTAVAVGSTPLLYQFFFNNALLYPENKADLAMRGPDLGVQGVSVADVFNYFKSNAAGYRDVGFGANINGIPTSVQRTPVDWIYRFPLAYGNQDSCASHFEISVPLLGYYGQHQVRHNEVDGWGTLVLPADTFEVLRVKSRIQRIDTVYIDQFGIGFSLPEPEAIEYKWLAPGMAEPVLQVTATGGVNGAARFYYRPEDSTAGVVSRPSSGAALRAWPNPATDALWVDAAPRARLELVAADGRVVRILQARGGGADRIATGDLAPGAYTLRALNGGAALRVLVAR